MDAYETRLLAMRCYNLDTELMPRYRADLLVRDFCFFVTCLFVSPLFVSPLLAMSFSTTGKGPSLQ